MLKAISQLLRKLIGNGGARLLTGMGISIASYAALAAATTAALAGVTSTFSGIGADVANLMMLCGVGQALSIVGAAMLTKAAVQSGSLGLTKTSS